LEKQTVEDLTFNEAFLFKYGIGQNIHWAKAIWSPDIPPSKSFLAWRLMHNKVPTYENLMLRGNYMPSILLATSALKLLSIFSLSVLLRL